MEDEFQRDLLMTTEETLRCVVQTSQSTHRPPDTATSSRPVPAEAEERSVAVRSQQTEPCTWRRQSSSRWKQTAPAQSDIWIGLEANSIIMTARYTTNVEQKYNQFIFRFLPCTYTSL